jgi:hypothetical protein
MFKEMVIKNLLKEKEEQKKPKPVKAEVFISTSQFVAIHNIAATKPNSK